MEIAIFEIPPDSLSLRFTLYYVHRERVIESEPIVDNLKSQSNMTLAAQRKGQSYHEEILEDHEILTGNLKIPKSGI